MATFSLNTLSGKTANQKADVLLVTVNPIETKAVLEVHQATFQRPATRMFIGDKTYFDLGELGGARSVLVRSEMGAIGLGASLQTVAAGIDDLQPSAVVMIGIAFGVDATQASQQIGDVLVARQLLLYDPQRVGVGTNNALELRFRGDRPSASPRLLDRFWAGHLDWSEAAVHFGLVLSGEKLIDHPDFLSQLLAYAPEAVGGEMEGAGLYTAAHQRKVDWILVKAISDWANGQKNANKSENQLHAAQKAAQFVFHVIRQGGFVHQSAAPTATPVVTDAGGESRGEQLRQLLAARVNTEELWALCFALHIDYENLRGEGKTAKVLALILYLERRNELHRLEAWLQKNRPDITLPA